MNRVSTATADITTETFNVSTPDGRHLGSYTVDQIGRSARAMGRAHRRAAEAAGEAHGIEDTASLVVTPV